jgi:hypothetical protein
MQRAFLPDMGSPTMPSGTAFQPGCLYDTRLYIARRRVDYETLPNVVLLADRGQMRHNRRPLLDTIRLTTEDVAPWVHGCVHLLPHAVRRAVMVLLHTTSPDLCVHRRG